MIGRFRFKYYFLSNFYPCKVNVFGNMFDCVEAAFQSQKNPENQHLFTGLTGSQAKALGRQMKLRDDWELVKLDIMYEALRAKFDQNADLKELLLKTGEEEIVEINNWGDKYWGVTNGVGENHLGKLLMRIRGELNSNE